MASPSETLLANGVRHQVVHDANGRALTVRDLTALDRLRLFKAVGPVLSENTAYLGMAMLACSISAIEDVPIPMPLNEAQLEGLIAKLGDAGISAIAEVFAATIEPDEHGALLGN